jgi:hypothetical protein
LGTWLLRHKRQKAKGWLKSDREAKVCIIVCVSQALCKCRSVHACLCVYVCYFVTNYTGFMDLDSEPSLFPPPARALTIPPYPYQTRPPHIHPTTYQYVCFSLSLSFSISHLPLTLPSLPLPYLPPFLLPPHPSLPQHPFLSPPSFLLSLLLSPLPPFLLHGICVLVPSISG